MARLARRSVLIAFLPIAFCRLGYDLRPTQTNYAADQFDFEWGWSPVPTAMPNALNKLSRRQGIVPNSTCGFISGLSTSALTCNDGLYCGFNSLYDAAACCSQYELVGTAYTLTGCYIFTTCYDSTAVAANCDSACQLNTHDLRCEQSSQPYCITFSFTDISYTILGCYEISGLTQYLALTYNAPTTTVDTTIPSTVIITTSVITTSEITTIFTTTTPSTTSPSMSLAPSSVVYTTSAGSTGVSGAVNTYTETATVTTTASGTGQFSGSKPGSSSGSSSSNIGAIAGGVGGGVVGLAIIAGLIWFFMRRRKKHGTGLPTPEVSQHTSTQYPYSPVSPNTQGPSQYGSPNTQGPGQYGSPNTQGPGQYGSPVQVHEFPATAVRGAYNHPMDYPQRDYQHGQYGQAHEISSEGTSSSRPLSPGYSNAPEAVQQAGYRGVDPTGGGYGNPNASYGAEPGFYGRPYSEMP